MAQALINMETPTEENVRVIREEIFKVVRNGLELYITNNENKASDLLKAIKSIGFDNLVQILANSSASKIHQLEMAKVAQLNSDVTNDQVAIVRKLAERKRLYGYYRNYWQVIYDMDDENIRRLLYRSVSTDENNIAQIIYLRIRKGWVNLPE